MDGHDSHNTIKFDAYCRDRSIITLCMPPHASHLLQPLDVGVFGPLKKAYGREIESLMRVHINHITKLDFLPSFTRAFDKAFTESNICGSFRGSGLVPLDPDMLISKLDIRLRTPSLEPLITPWESQTPQNAIEIGLQATYVRQRVARHQSSSPTAFLAAIDSLVKGTEYVAHKAVIIADEAAKLRESNELLSRRKGAKKKVLPGKTRVRVSDGLQIIAESTLDMLQNPLEVPNGDTPVPRQRRCGRCRQPGHRRETCQMPQPQTPVVLDEIEVICE